MKNKRVKMMIAAICMMSLFLAACGGGNNKQGSDSGADKEAESSAGGTVEIEFFNQKPEISDYVEELIKKFESENPDIKVTQTQVPDAGTVLNSRLATGDIPDIIHCYPNESEYLTMVGADYYMDLTGEAVLEEVNPSFLENIKVDGKDYSIPLTLNGWGIFYNKTQFEALGLKEPQTWEDLVKVCETIKESGINPFATSLKEGWTTGHIGEAVALSIAGADDARDFFGDTSVKVEDTGYYDEFINRLDLFYENSQTDATSTEYADAAAMFARGDSLMMPQGIWALPMFEQAGMTDEIGMFPLPNDDGKGVIQYGVDFAVSISAETKHPEEAKAFVKFLASEEAAQYLADREGSPSTIEGVTTDVPQTEGVTSMLFEEGRNELWYHFEWNAGVDSEWGNEVASYFVLQDQDTFAAALNSLFEK